jgi:penicillin-binding protein 1B
MGGPRRKRKISPWWNWRRVALAVFLLASFGTGFYLAQLYGEISTLISERSAGLTSAIYGAPLVIRRGDDLARLRLLDRLTRLSYTAVNHLPRPGEYEETPDSITIYLRSFDYAGRKIPASLVHLTLEGATVTGIADAFGMPNRFAILEPEVIGRLYAGAPAARVEVTLNDLPPYLVRGLIATEDRFFYWHFGFDPIRIVEAAFADWRRHRLAEGASTLTQQLARTFMGERRRTLGRKLREAAVALVIEIRLSKREILERYINDVPMGSYDGNPIEGLPVAARYLFNKDLARVTPAEAATLIGMIQAPTMYDPRRHPEAARQRRDVVLGIMHHAGLISDSEYEEALASPVEVAPAPGIRRAPYFTDYVTSIVARMPAVGASLTGMRVYTTLDPVLQADAQQTVEWNLERLERLHPGLRRSRSSQRLEGSLVALDARTGAIVAMVGGRDYATSQFNRVTQAKRQPGSAFKPIVYLAALDPSRSPLRSHVTLATMLPDRPMSFGGWTPADYERTYRGEVTVADALADSLNVPTAYLGSLLGAPRMVRTAHELGISGHLDPVLPIAIGADDVTLLDLVGAYQVFADEGVAHPPYGIVAVIDGKNHVIYRHGEDAPRRLIRPDVDYLITAALQGVIRYGTGEGAAGLGVDFPAAGKTGTTEDYHDAYFVGYTPSLVAGVWVGFDRPRSIGLPGAVAALPAWARFMVASARRGESFKIPAGITMASIDPASGDLATAACPRRQSLPFLTGTEPTVLCPLHSGTGASSGGLLTATRSAPMSPGVLSAAAAASTPAPSSPPASSGFFAGVGHFFGSIFGAN